MSRHAHRTPPHPLRAAWLLLVALGCGRDPGSDGPRSAVIVTLDTTRADALGAYGGPPGLTPCLDALAAEATVYERAYTPAPLTQPAHASLLTGLLPPRHGVRVNGVHRLPASARTLAEAAREAGLRTGAFVGAVVLDPGFGLDQGFEVYDAPSPELAPTSTHYAERRGIEVVDAALRWLATVREDERFLLWVHLFDPHAPFDPPLAFRERAPGGDPYLGEVAYADHQVGRLLDALRPRWPGLLVVVAADHGEGLGDHGEPSHGAFCYESTARVPLIVRWPDGRRAGERSREVVTLVDVAPTVAELLGLSLDRGFGLDGRSLAAPRAAGGAYLESYYGYLSYGWSPLAGWVDARGKYLHSSSPQYFALGEDPGETHDLFPDVPDLEAYRAALADVASRPRLSLEEASGASAEVARALASLGYASATRTREELPDPLAPSDRPSPGERAGEQVRLLEAMNLGASGRVEEARELLAALVAANPRNYEAVDHLTFCLMRLGRHAEAIAPLRAVLAESPERPNTQTYLGVCLMVVGRVEEALEPLAAALALQPDHLQALGAMGDALAYLGREEEAETYLRRFRALQEGR